jgi:hypothetical protein
MPDRPENSRRHNFPKTRASQRYWIAKPQRIALRLRRRNPRIMRTEQSLTRILTVIGIVAMPFGRATWAEDPIASVTLTHPSAPSAGLLESGMRINVSHINVNWNTRWNERGGTRVLRWYYDYRRGYRSYVAGIIASDVGFDDGSAGLWVNQARGDLEASIQSAARHAGIQLVLVDRTHVADRLNESDLEIAEVVESPPMRRRVKSLPADAKIYADIDIDINVQTGSETTISGIYSWYRPCGWRWHSRIDFSRRRSIRRIITFQATFTLEDARTGQIWTTHAASWQPIDTERPSALFGSDKGLIDFNQPDDVLVMQFLNREVANFVAKLVPSPTSIAIRVPSSSDADCKRGVRLLAAGSYADAYRALCQAIGDDHDDDRAHFAAGVACEKLGDWRLARSHYRAALRCCEPIDCIRYREALSRLEHIDTQPPRY